MSLEGLLGSLVACAAAVVLAGCNLVYSEKPLFTAADEAGAAPLRPGLWRSDDPKCRVNQARPVQGWPRCASWVLVRSGEILQLETDEKPPVWVSFGVVLAAGDPRILQTAIVDDAGAQYGYTALRPLKLDDLGRIVAFTSWPVQCGPPPAGTEPGPPPTRDVPSRATGSVSSPEERRSSVTRAPLPGLEIKDANCIAGESGPVRAAAVASEAWAGEAKQVNHWVRDTLP